MIQRKQTVFLLIAIILMICNLFYPFVKSDNFLFDAFKIVIGNGETVIHKTSIYLAIYLILNSLLILFTIFKFKRRAVQMRFAILSMLFSIGFYGLLVFYHFWISYHYPISYKQYSFGLVSPLISSILCYMAYSGVKSDEKLVRDSDRLR